MTYGNYPDLKNIRRILVVKMRHHGDVLLASSFFSNLQRAIPSAQIDPFIYLDTLPMLEGHPAISECILYDRAWKKLPFWKKIAKELSLLVRIYRGKYDLVINLTEGDRGSLAAWISRARYRVGFDPGKKGLFAKRKLYTHLVKNCPHPRHTVERQLDVLRRIGIFPEMADRDLFLHIPEDAKIRVQALLQERGVNGPYVVIHPVSRWRFKCLSPRQMAQVIELLHSKNQTVVLSCGREPQEIAMIEEILLLVPSIPVVNLAGQITLKELAALISSSAALISVDSVPLHIASATKTPVVALFGPTSEKNWGPWMHQKARVIAQNFSCRPCYQDGCGGSKKSDCLLSIDPKAIVAALEEVLEMRSVLKMELQSSI